MQLGLVFRCVSFSRQGSPAGDGNDGRDVRLAGWPSGHGDAKRASVMAVGGRLMQEGSIGGSRAKHRAGSKVGKHACNFVTYPETHHLIFAPIIDGAWLLDHRCYRSRGCGDWSGLEFRQTT